MTPEQVQQKLVEQIGDFGTYKLGGHMELGSNIIADVRVDFRAEEYPRYEFRVDVDFHRVMGLDRHYLSELYELVVQVRKLVSRIEHVIGNRVWVLRGGEWEEV